METWLSWILGFFIWICCIALLALITYLITTRSSKNWRGHIPDTAFNYYYRPDFIPKDAYLLDTHSHTVASDGWMTPEQCIRWHIANGYNAFVLTDHNTSKNNQEILNLQEKYPEILIIPGFEWTTNNFHMNFLGIKEYLWKVPSIADNENIQFAIQKAKSLGAVIQADHISWTLNEPRLRSGELTHPSRDQLYNWGIDGFEINNEMRWYDPKTLHWLNSMKEKEKLTRPLFQSTGTDIHSPLKEWATGWTEILLTPEEKKNPSWEKIKNAMLQGRTRIWVDHDYRKPPELKSVQYSEDQTVSGLTAPFYGLAYSATKIPGNIKGIMSYISWLLIAYFPLRILFTWLISF